MNPLDVLMFAISLLVAVLLVVLRGGDIRFIGPAALLVLGAGWRLWMEWLRYRQWVRYRDTDFVPGTQHLALLGTLGFFVCGAAAFVWLVLALQPVQGEQPSRTPDRTVAEGP